MFLIKRMTVQKQFDEHRKLMDWADAQFKRMEKEMNAVFGSCCDEDEKKTPADEKTTRQSPSPESTVNRRLEDNAISMLERIRTAGGLPAGPETGMPCRVEYDRSKGAFLVYLAGNPYRPDSL